MRASAGQARWPGASRRRRRRSRAAGGRGRARADRASGSGCVADRCPATPHAGWTPAPRPDWLPGSSCRCPPSCCAPMITSAIDRDSCYSVGSEEQNSGAYASEGCQHRQLRRRSATGRRRRRRSCKRRRHGQVRKRSRQTPRLHRCSRVADVRGTGLLGGPARPSGPARGGSLAGGCRDPVANRRRSPYPGANELLRTSPP